MRRVLALAALALAAICTAQAQQSQAPQPSQTQPAAQAWPDPSHPQRTADGHEYASLEERALKYKDWTLKRWDTGEAVSLREWARDKKLVMVVYFAPWCGNWRMEKSVVARLYEKYHPHGFDVIGVSNYGTPADLKASLDAHPVPYTVVVESDSQDARQKTAHYAYRRQTGDARKWGSPYNVLLEPAKLNQTGDVLAERVWVVGGELVEPEVEQFIRGRLGLPQESGLKADAKPVAKP